MKKKMLPILFLMLLMLGGSGCEEPLTPEQIKLFAQQQEVLQAEVDKLQAEAERMTAELAEAGIVDPNAEAKIKKINEEADRLQGHIDIIAKAISGVELTDSELQNWLKILQTANAASAPFNPYALPVSVGLGLAGIVFGWFERREAAKKAKKAILATKKYTAHKQGVELTMKEVSISDNPDVKGIEAKLYKNIGTARSTLNIGG